MDKGNAIIGVCLAVALIGGATLWSGSDPASTTGSSQQSSSGGNGGGGVTPQPQPSPAPIPAPPSPNPPGPRPVVPPQGTPQLPPAVVSQAPNVTPAVVYAKRRDVDRALQQLQSLPAHPAIAARQQQVLNGARFAFSQEQIGELGNAYAGYDAALRDAAQLQASAAELVKADAALKATDAQRARAEKVNMAVLAKGKWDDAEAARGRAGAAFQAGRYGEAMTQAQAADGAYRAGIVEASKGEIERLMRVARANANEAGAFAARDALRQVLALDANNAEAPQLSRTIDPFLYLRNGLDQVLARVPAGKFMLGSPQGQWGASEAHQAVQISKEYWVGTIEVTQAQFEAVMGVNPSLVRGAQLPVTNVTWGQADEFCRELSKREKRTYRLPTEAEWEYACRAGSPEPFSGNPARVEDVAWYAANTTAHEPQPVGQKRANAWGLYDMHGNVAEWCADRLPDSYDIAPVDPVGQRPKSVRDVAVVRGGGFDSYDRQCRSASRRAERVSASRPSLGFRVVTDAQ